MAPLAACLRARRRPTDRTPTEPRTRVTTHISSTAGNEQRNSISHGHPPERKAQRTCARPPACCSGAHHLSVGRSRPCSRQTLVPLPTHSPPQPPATDDVAPSDRCWCQRQCRAHCGYRLSLPASRPPPLPASPPSAACPHQLARQNRSLVFECAACPRAVGGTPCRFQVEERPRPMLLIDGSKRAPLMARCGA